MPQVFFFDGFEYGLGNWSTSGDVQDVFGSIRFSGAGSCFISDDGVAGRANVANRFLVMPASGYLGCRFVFDPVDDGGQPLAAATNIAALYAGNTILLEVGVARDGSGTFFFQGHYGIPFSVPLTANAWNAVELDAYYQGGQLVGEVWLNETRVGGPAGIALGAPQVTTFQLSAVDPGGSVGWKFYFDNVSLADGPFHVRNFGQALTAAAGGGASLSTPVIRQRGLSVISGALTALLRNRRFPKALAASSATAPSLSPARIIFHLLSVMQAPAASLAHPRGWLAALPLGYTPSLSRTITWHWTAQTGVSELPRLLTGKGISQLLVANALGSVATLARQRILGVALLLASAGALSLTPGKKLLLSLNVVAFPFPRLQVNKHLLLTLAVARDGALALLKKTRIVSIGDGVHATDALPPAPLTPLVRIAVTVRNFIQQLFVPGPTD